MRKQVSTLGSEYHANRPATAREQCVAALASALIVAGLTVYAFVVATGG